MQTVRYGIWAICLTFFLTPALSRHHAAYAQKLRASDATGSAPALKQLVREGKKPTTKLSEYGLTGGNKPNGEIYRLRRFVPVSTPPFVERVLPLTPQNEVDSLQLELAEPVADGWLALYASPIIAGSWKNQHYRIVLYNAKSRQASWELDPATVFSRSDYLEIQDIRYENGKLYFNEACMTYAKDAKGQCSSLLCLDPVAKKVLWRTPPLVSNNMFVPYKQYIICGYGFTGEKDYVYVLDKTTGKILYKNQLESAQEYLEVKDGLLHVVSYKHHAVFQMPE